MRSLPQPLLQRLNFQRCPTEFLQSRTQLALERDNLRVLALEFLSVVAGIYAHGKAQYTLIRP